ncbi:multidrug resistance protein mrp-7 isoform X4 [Parasteatoda tepidariorum]|uniref:multidrug resistance protein mrp-7 isoform X4 n=1 Tax=Parasteatoda tepidariorum TaxID=114398 RepID=UPI0039BD26FE
MFYRLIWQMKKNKPDPSWPSDGNIKLEQYATRYREGLEIVLKGISCNINPSERAAGGKILIDGVEISKLGLHDLRSKLTIIPQYWSKIVSVLGQIIAT